MKTAREGQALPDRTRVAMLDMRPRLCAIVADAVADEPDLEIVTIESGAANVEARRPGIDVLIVGTDNPDDDAVAKQLLAALPRTRVLMVATSGRRAVIYELRPEKLDLGEISADVIVSAIRRSDSGLWRRAEERRH